MEVKAAVMRQVGRPLSIEEVTVAEPGPHEVLIRVAAAGLCHSDVRFMEGSYETPLPTVMGHESAGVVLRVGDQVTHVVPGDHVITSLTVACGHCAYCAGDKPYLCDHRDETRRVPDEPSRLMAADGPVNQFLNLGSFAETMLVHESAVVRVTKEIPLDRAALLGCGVATGLGAVLNTAKVHPGESVAVLGLGGVGLSAVQGAGIAGAEPIIAIDRVPDKLELAKTLGASVTVDAGREDIHHRVMEITGGLGVHHAFEAVGSTNTVEIAFSFLRRGGTLTVIGLIPSGQEVRIPVDGLYWERKLQASVMGSNRLRVDIPRYVDMYLEGRLNLDDMVTDRIELSAINDGFARLLTGKVARILVVFEETEGS